jgi:hypothetical protein
VFRLHIREHFFNGLDLIGRFFMFKSGFKFTEGVVGPREGETPPVFSEGVDFDELLGNLSDGFPGFFLGYIP